jgi:hypothetical protein
VEESREETTLRVTAAPDVPEPPVKSGSEGYGKGHWGGLAAARVGLPAQSVEIRDGREGLDGSPPPDVRAENQDGPEMQGVSLERDDSDAPVNAESERDDFPEPAPGYATARRERGKPAD